MGTDRHAAERNRQDLRSPPAGRDDDDTHALRAGEDGTSPRRQRQAGERPTRDEGRDDRRSGSDSNP